MFFKEDSATEIGTSCASMNRTGKTNSKKGPHNAYRDFHEREFESRVVSAFMEYAGMKSVEGQKAIYTQNIFLSRSCP